MLIVAEPLTTSSHQSTKCVSSFSQLISISARVSGRARSERERERRASTRVPFRDQHSTHATNVGAHSLIRPLPPPPPPLLLFLRHICAPSAADSLARSLQSTSWSRVICFRCYLHSISIRSRLRGPGAWRHSQHHTFSTRCLALACVGSCGACFSIAPSNLHLLCGNRLPTDTTRYTVNLVSPARWCWRAVLVAIGRLPVM